MKTLFGTGVALVTPFAKDGSIDYTGLKKLLDHTAHDVDYYVVMGTTGESATLDEQEKREILQFIKENNSAKLPLVVGIGGNNTASVLKAIRNTDLDGVDAILSVSPYYNKPSQEGIYQHYQALADESPAPIILYNVPGRTMSNLSADTTLRLAAHSNIIGVKEASGNLEQAMAISQGKADDFMLISGDDMLSGAIYAMGGVGVISVLANAFPVLFRTLKEGAFANDFSKVRESLFPLLEINPLMYAESNPVGLKHVLHILSICEHYVRLPLVEASSTLQKKIEEAIKKIPHYQTH